MDKKQQLKEKINEYAKEDICLAFSGGVDSSLLLKLVFDAVSRTGKKVYAVTFDTKLHPACDLENAKKIAKEIGGIHEIIKVDELEQKEIRNNPINRCYLCKYYLFQKLRKFADEKKVNFILEGTNEDDLHRYRPGIKALLELDIISPLADAQITKQEVKEMAAEYGLSAASRPSTPCMATRLPYYSEINYEILKKIADGEEYLRNLIGGNVRLRLHKDIARIEVNIETFSKILEKKDEIIKKLKTYGFSYICLDIEGFRSGSMDIYIERKDNLQETT